MTLYVLDDANGWNPDTYREATWQERKREDGWENCSRCGGSGWYYENMVCPDCAHGLVPPEEMIEAAVEIFTVNTAVGTYGLEGIARAVLVAAARKEKP